VDTDRHWVLKLGGSLLEAPELDAWLATTVGAGAGRCVVVPGGGPFADRVRDSQPRLGFSDAAAHDMALLAMAQTGHLLMDRQPALAPAASVEAIRAAWRQVRTPVWLPQPLALRAAKDIRPGWEVTSDSLSAWLAGRLGVPRLALVKSVPRPAVAPTLAAILAAGVVDEAFAHHCRASGVEVHLLAREDHRLFETALAGGTPPPGRLA